MFGGFEHWTGDRCRRGQRDDSVSEGVKRDKGVVWGVTDTCTGLE